MAEAGPLPRTWLLRALKIEGDRQSGATRLSLEAVRAFRDAADEERAASDREQARARLEAYAARLRAAQPSMAPVATRLKRCVCATKAGVEAAIVEADSILAEVEDIERRLAAAARPLFRPGVRVITHSSSETVLALLREHAAALERVTVCEARPLNEGVRMAAAVADWGLPVRLITEAQLDLFITQCDLAVVGADRVLPDGGVVNKAGTAVLAHVCRGHRVPLYVAADRSKWATEGDELIRFAQECRSPGEVLSSPPAGVEVMNVPFDLTPPELVHGYVTEDGITTIPT